MVRFKIIVALLVFSGTFVAAQSKKTKVECPEPKEENYKKVTSSAFAEDYEDCPVIIVAEYFKDGFMTGYRKPNKLKNMYFFQCVDVGMEGTKAALTNELTGNLFVIEKELADQVLGLKPGDKIRVTCTTFTQIYYGTEIGNYVIAKKVEKL
jgi:hypothetical protein